MLRKVFLCLLFYVMCTSAFAQGSLPHFRSLADQSTLAFETVWDGSPLHGKFTRFESDILFDPNDLPHSKVEASIDMTSVFVENSDVVNTLSEKEWFDSDSFPKAFFRAENFTHLNDNRYQAEGVLTIKEHAVPCNISFILTEFSPQKAAITGTATIKRKDFSIGWSTTDSIANEVKITITLAAKGIATQ